MAAEYYVGLMSGTSLDGVDAVLASFDGEHTECVASHYQPFDETIRSEALSLHENGYDELHRAALLDNQLATAYADATRTLLEKVSRGDMKCPEWGTPKLAAFYRRRRQRAPDQAA